MKRLTYFGLGLLAAMVAGGAASASTNYDVQYPANVFCGDQSTMVGVASNQITCSDGTGVFSVTQLNSQGTYARGDGSTDDTVAINQTIADAACYKASLGSGTRKDNGGLRGVIVYFPGTAGVRNIASLGGSGTNIGVYVVSNTIGMTPANTSPLPKVLPPGKAAWTCPGTNRNETGRIIFQGEGSVNTASDGNPSTRTEILVAPSSPNFNVTGTPTPVLWTTGGIGTMASVSSFGNYVNDIAINTGTGNTEAIGLLFQGNNDCGINDVSITSGDGQGIDGLDFGTYLTGTSARIPGPCLFTNLSVAGFPYGIRTTGHNQYSLTFNIVSLTNQTVAGVYDPGSAAIAFNNLTSSQSQSGVPAIDAYVGTSANPNSPFITVLTANLGATSAQTGNAISVTGTKGVPSFYFENVSWPNYAHLVTGDPSTGGTTASYATNQGSPTYLPSDDTVMFGSSSNCIASLGMTVYTPPTYDLNPYQTTWVEPTIGTTGVPGTADPYGQFDSTAAIQAALHTSTGSVVYLPPGTYLVENTLTISSTNLQKLVSLGATILNPTKSTAQIPAYSPIVEIASGSAPLIIQGLNFGSPDGGDTVKGGVSAVTWINDDSSNALSVLNSSFGGFHNTAGANPTPNPVAAGASPGQLFLQEIDGGPWNFTEGQRVWAWELDDEVNMTHVSVTGADLWLFGLKTEQPATIMDVEPGTTAGSNVEMLGSFFLPISNTLYNSGTPGFTVNNGVTIPHYSNVSLGYRSLAQDSGDYYNDQIVETAPTPVTWLDEDGNATAVPRVKDGTGTTHATSNPLFCTIPAPGSIP